MDYPATAGAHTAIHEQRAAPGLSRRGFLAGLGLGGASVGILGMGMAIHSAKPVRPALSDARPVAPLAPTTAASGSIGASGAGGETLPGIATLAGPVQRRIAALPPGPLFWHVESFSSLAEAHAAASQYALAVEAEGKGWLFTLGPHDLRTAGATHLTEIGPLPVPEASEYLLQLSYQSRAGKLVGSEHSHPGVECWYMVKGEQQVELPTLDKVLVASAGEGMLGPPGATPLRISNTGSGERRAFNLFVLDSTRPAANEGADVATVDAAFKRSFQAGDLDTTMDLFAAETVEISPFGVFPGKSAIRGSVENFVRANPGFEATFSESKIVDNTAVHRAFVTSNPIRATDISRFVLIHTVVVSRGKIVMLAQQLDLSDVETARYAIGLAPEGR
jgi:hypothetical protein